MPNLDYRAYRPRGLYSEQVALNVVEGDPAATIPDQIDDSGLPTGYYKFTLALDWTCPLGKYMLFTFILNSTESKTYRVVSTSSAPADNDKLIQVILPITGGLVNWSSTFEFPDQSGSSTCVIDQEQISYEKWGEFPVL